MGEWDQGKTIRVPAGKTQWLVPPAGRLHRGGLSQDGGAPRGTSLDSAAAHIGAESTLAGSNTPTQGDATPKASCTASAHGGGVASHSCKEKDLSQAGKPFQ